MFTYHLKIAIASLRRNPILTGLLIAAIALGICVSTSFVTLRHLFTKDPLPGKSDQVFYVQLDSWSPNEPYREDDPELLPDQVTYRDARGLRNSTIPARQTATCAWPSPTSSTSSTSRSATAVRGQKRRTRSRRRWW